jgi:hypothetical protein
VQVEVHLLLRLRARGGRVGGRAAAGDGEAARRTCTCCTLRSRSSLICAVRFWVSPIRLAAFSCSACSRLSRFCAGRPRRAARGAAAKGEA